MSKDVLLITFKLSFPFVYSQRGEEFGQAYNASRRASQKLRFSMDTVCPRIPRRAWLFPLVPLPIFLSRFFVGVFRLGLLWGSVLLGIG